MYFSGFNYHYLNYLERYFILILLFIILSPVCLFSQDQQLAEGDSIGVSDDFFSYSDSIVAVEVVEVDSAQIAKAIIPKEAFRPNSTRAVIYSAILPGLGQIYNRKYWKLPLVYGGFLGCAYAITWNGNQYNDYKGAYKDFIDDDDSTNSWRPYIPASWDEDPSKWSESNRTWFPDALKRKRDYYRRYRDLSYIITVGLYVICMIDAYVDAELFDFDISQDLSMRVDPVLFQRTSTNPRAVGLQCSFTF